MSLINQFLSSFAKKPRTQRRKSVPKIKETVQATPKPDTYNEWITQLQYQTK